MPRRPDVVEEGLRRRGVEREGEGELPGDDQREVADLGRGGGGREKKKKQGERKNRKKKEDGEKSSGTKLSLSCLFSFSLSRSHPDSDQRHHGQQRRAHRPDKVAPRPAAVHQPVEERQPPLKERVPPGVEDDLEVPFRPAGALLEAVADLVWGLADGEVFLHVAAVPAALLELHAQGKVLGEGVLGGPAMMFFFFFL